VESEYYLVLNYLNCPGLYLSVLPENQVRLVNIWAKYCDINKKVGDDVTFLMYNYSTEFKGVIVYKGTKLECYERFSQFSQMIKLELEDVDFE